MRNDVEGFEYDWRGEGFKHILPLVLIKGLSLPRARLMIPSCR